MNVMEMSHRSKGIRTLSIRRRLICVFDEYSGQLCVLLQGGASLQFAMVPLNLTKYKKAHFVKTGQWAKAIEQAKSLGRQQGRVF